MTATVTIAGKALGKRKPLFADWSLPLPPELSEGSGDGGLTLRDLIARVVRAEVAAFKDRQAERRLQRVLSAAEIEEGAASGKVDGGGRPLDQPVDIDDAVQAAWDACADGIYLVVVDGARHQDLDAQVYLHADSTVTFVRLVMLAGG